MARMIRSQNKAYAVEVLGDPDQVFRVVSHPLRRFWREFFRRAQKDIVRRAAAAMFVSGTLANLYPPAQESVKAIVSDVRLSQETFQTPRSVRSALGMIRLISVGNMDQLYKGHHFLLEAIHSLRGSGWSVEAKIIGDGQYRKQLEAQAAALGVGGHVRFLGAVPWGGSLFQELDWADLFVMCSLTEGLPKALLEAMARGLPAVATNVGGIPELLETEELVPPANVKELARRIAELAKDPVALTRLSHQNVARAKQYREDDLRNKRIQFYRDYQSLAAAKAHHARVPSFC
jgi:glycosyltransferase involved in cell wall biosynthesis